MATTSLLGPTLVTLVVTVAPQVVLQNPAPCDDLYAMLQEVPHIQLDRINGPFESTWDGAEVEGCVIEFETTDSTLAGRVGPDLHADEGSDLFVRGWRMHPTILADGAGSGVYAIERGATLCIVRWEQPAYIDDSGEFVQSDTLTVLIQCSDRATGSRSSRVAALPRSAYQGEPDDWRQEQVAEVMV